MIKIALKHWIYEKCIDVLFKAIGNNFCFCLEKNKFRIGDNFEFIVILPNHRGVYTEGVTLYNGTILNNDRGILTVEFYGKSYYSKRTDRTKKEFYGNHPGRWQINITEIEYCVMSR